VACIAPSAASEGRVLVDLSLNEGVDFARSGFEFIYEAAATVEELRPSRGLSGSAGVTVVVRHFARSEELKCLFGDVQVAAIFTSSTEIVCRAPERGEGVVLVSVNNNGADLGRGEVKFEYAVSGHVVSIVPSKGPTSGSTRVTIHGDGRKAVEVSGAMCVFGKMEAGAVEEGSKLICVSPRVSTAGTVQFMLRDKQSGTQMTATVSFEFYEAASIASLVPSTGYVGGGSIVTVIGSGLSADSLV
jgi:hypothetical protein